MDHEDLRHKLSEYIDGGLDPRERAEVEEHIKTCADCAEALRELEKTVEHLRSIEEVDPPAWMTQKIMARVREEQSRKKSLFERLFLPLHIKLPLEALGLVFLAVTVFFMFRPAQYEKRFAESPVDGIAGQPSKVPPAAPSSQAPGKKATSDEAPQKQEYKALDMKPEYESSQAAPAPAPAPAPDAKPAESEPQSFKGQGFASRERAPEPMRDQAVAPAAPMAKRKSEAGATAGNRAVMTEKSANACLSYEPQVVAVTGIITKRDFAGPPNYESIEAGDARETTWVLKLEKAVCVQGGGQKDLDEPESNITEIQLVLDSSQYARYQSMISKRVSVKGTLFHSHTGHHHTPVLMTVQNITRLF